MHSKLTGLTLVLLGTLAVLQTLGVYNFGLTFWPAVLLWIGLEMVWGSLCNHHHGGTGFGVVLGLWVGSLGLLPILSSAGLDLNLTTADIIRGSWPLLLVGVGVSLLFSRRNWQWH